MSRAMIVGVMLTAAVGCETTAYLDPSEMGSYVPAGARTAGAAAFDEEEARSAVSRDATLTRTAQKATPESPPALAAPETPPATREISRRLVVYSASLRVVVASSADARASVQAIANDAGGYLQESDARSITIRVPADRFEATVAAIEKLGDVVDRAVKASDVSEQMLDLDIRLDNARAARDRLKAHLAKSEKMEDTIRLEAELSRVTTEIELLEGKRRLLASQIAMSTIRVDLNAAKPQTTRGEAAASPFSWIAQLGDGLVAGAGEAMPRQPRFLAGGPAFSPPGGFVRYFSSKDLVEAMNADGVRIKLQRHANFDRGPIDFWQSLARRSLVETRALAVSEAGPLAEDASWSHVVGTREVAGKRMSYLLMLSRTNDHVYTFEAWGPAERVEPLVPSLVASARSLKR